MSTVELAPLTLPDFGLPTVEPSVPASTYAARLKAAWNLAQAAGLDALVVYGDREHFANIAYLTGYDPRFEEALLIVTGEQQPALLIGNEGWGYAELCPLPVKRVLYQSFSLLAQPRDRSPRLEQILRAEGLHRGSRVGVVGWKYFDERESDAPQTCLEIPSYIADALREITGDPETVTNATP
ncbi:MAG: aminopeptidase P family N-terminal domain-containing protein, partial [Chloroflexota bacterium]